MKILTKDKKSFSFGQLADPTVLWCSTLYGDNIAIEHLLTAIFSISSTILPICSAMPTMPTMPSTYRWMEMTLAGTGTDVKTLQAIAGHADIQITMNRYVHKQTDHIIDAGSRMQALLST